MTKPNKYEIARKIGMKSIAQEPQEVGYIILVESNLVTQNGSHANLPIFVIDKENAIALCKNYQNNGKCACVCVALADEYGVISATEEIYS